MAPALPVRTIGGHKRSDAQTSRKGKHGKKSFFIPRGHTTFSFLRKEVYFCFEQTTYQEVERQNPNSHRSFYRCRIPGVAFISHSSCVFLYKKTLNGLPGQMKKSQPLLAKADIELAHFSDYLLPVHSLGVSFQQTGT